MSLIMPGGPTTRLNPARAQQEERIPFGSSAHPSVHCSVTRQGFVGVAWGLRLRVSQHQTYRLGLRAVPHTLGVGPTKCIAGLG